jgi:nucleoside-triphosphatase THEP1
MGRAVILHAPIGGGKTMTALAAIEMAKGEDIRIMGILSRRVFDGDMYPSYELLNLETEEVAPLVKPANRAYGKDWESYGNPVFVFSKKGLYEANLALNRAAEELKNGVVVFVDEYGRLESQGKGIYPGAVKVANTLRRGGTAVFLCRDDKVEEVVALLRNKSVRTFDLEAGDPEALIRIIREFSKL